MLLEILTSSCTVKKFGARVIIEGAHIGESKEVAESLVEKEGLVYVNGYDDPPILAGAGTIGMEIIDDVPDVDVVVVPVGGGGLIAGISCAIKTLKPDCQVIGASVECCRRVGVTCKNVVTT